MHRHELPHWPAFGADFDPGEENVAFLRQLWEGGDHRRYFSLVHPQLSWPNGMPSLGLAENPGPRHANSRWRAWRDDYLAALQERFPGNAAVAQQVREVELVLRWRADVPAQHRFWVDD